MTKLFLIFLLITKHSFTICSDWEPEVFKAIRYGVDFSRLSSTRDALYTKQVQIKKFPIYVHFLPIELAVIHENISAINWLISKQVNLNDSNALKYALDLAQRDGDRVATIVHKLLVHGASIGIVINGQKPQDYLKSLEQDKLDFYRMRPFSKINERLFGKMYRAKKLLERYEAPLRWAWIAGAVVTAKTTNSKRVEIID